MPDATRRAPELDPMPDPAELRAAKAAGLTLVQYRAAQAAALAGVPVSKADLAELQRRHDQLEKAEQREVVKIFRAFGARVYSLSQARAAKQTPGLGDLFVIFPRVASFWWETKRPHGGRVSPAQQEFHQLCNAVTDGSAHFIGGRIEAERIVIESGLAYRDAATGALEPVRPPLAPGESDDDESDYTEADVIT